MSETFEPEIVLLYCGRSLAEGEYLSEGMKKYSGFKARFVMLPCSSKVEVVYLVKLIEQGAEGVMLVACPTKQCQFLVGSARAENRIRYARKLLAETGLGADRFSIVLKQGVSADEIVDVAEEHANAVRQLGPNPVK